jgi:hypothetical protein
MLKRQKGDIAECHAIAYFMENGYNVYLPIGVSSNCDMIAKKDGKRIGIQVKYAGVYNQRGKCCAALRVMGGNQSFYTAKKYADDAFDYLFVYTARGECYLFTWKEVKARTQLNIEAPVYRPYKVLMQG